MFAKNITLSFEKGLIRTFDVVTNDVLYPNFKVTLDGIGYWYLGEFIEDELTDGFDKAVSDLDDRKNYFGEPFFHYILSMDELGLTFEDAKRYVQYEEYECFGSQGGFQEDVEECACCNANKDCAKAIEDWCEEIEAEERNDCK